jgi:hypothetical protein
VNGEVIFTIRNSYTSGKATVASCDTSFEKGKENSGDMSNVLSRHSAGNITGLSLSEFVALPARAKITVCYESDCVGEGFFCMRKL